MEVLDGGPLTTVQDLPGRVGYWNVGVPPNGPMDDLSHRLANRMVGNDAGAAALELTGSGPTLRFTERAVIALGGAEMPVRIDGRSVIARGPLDISRGTIVEIGAIAGAGLRTYLAIRGGIDVEPYLGSRSTFTLGGFGGYDGRALQAGDVVPLGDPSRCSDRPASLAAGLTPALAHYWELGVLVGPHAAPDYLTMKGLGEFLRATWTVHFNSARTGVRLVGPKPLWARASGGEAGLHPSNIHDTGYAIGSVDITGDTPVVLGPDGPSLGGFVCPAVVVATERWKLGQLRPGDRVRLVPISDAAAESRNAQQTRWVARATAPIEPLARPSWNTPPRPAAELGDAVLARRVADVEADHPGVTYRRAGDRFVLVEYGPMMLDLELRARVHALEQWVVANLDGVVDATAGVRSLLVQVDGHTRGVASALSALQRAEDELGDVRGMEFPSRVMHLPLSWDDPATRTAIDRYVHGVRADAPWCPWNIEFIRRINGLSSVDDVHDTLFSARYLVLGLGDVYLGAPVATPLDPRHRLVTTKYNPARTWTPENAVGIGGAYLCIYGMEGPGGYQLVGRTVQVWNRDRRGPHFEQPWLLRNFDQIQFHPVEAAELMDQRDAQSRGELAIRSEPTLFRLSEQRRFLRDHAHDIAAFKSRQQAAFDEERRAWAAAGEVA
ncbi:MAG TPA: 5-oxoprolinase/urea amidolyase family protein [Acidimicrobiales bacterium]|nr:5-oxoprolinase/urea amidolyase family protein [Acidimicrobiales bacterium]